MSRQTVKKNEPGPLTSAGTPARACIPHRARLVDAHRPGGVRRGHERCRHVPTPRRQDQQLGLADDVSEGPGFESPAPGCLLGGGGVPVDQPPRPVCARPGNAGDGRRAEPARLQLRAEAALDPSRRIGRLADLQNPASPRGPRRALGAAALYAWCLDAILVSGYHCNTDPVYAFLCLLCVWLIADKGWHFRGGLVLAAALNVKLTPVLLAAPLLLNCRDWRQAGRFIAGLSMGRSRFCRSCSVQPTFARRFAPTLWHTPRISIGGALSSSYCPTGPTTCSLRATTSCTAWRVFITTTDDI